MQRCFIAELLTWLENVENEIRTDAYVIFALVALQIVRRCCRTLYMRRVCGGVFFFFLNKIHMRYFFCISERRLTQKITDTQT